MLPRVEFDRVFLTDGTWRSIAQCLRKCPQPTKLKMLSGLYQKQAAPPLVEALPAKYTVREYSIEILQDKADVQHFLDVVVQ
jgi:hypothetical protein